MSKSSARDGRWNKPVFQHQADATLSQGNPVSATLYTVLATTSNVRIIGIEADVTFTVQPTLDVVVTIDGVTMTFSVAAPATTIKQYASLDMSADATAQKLETTDRAATGRPFLLEGRSVLIQARRTGGTVTNLSARVKYAKIP